MVTRTRHRKVARRTRQATAILIAGMFMLSMGVEASAQTTATPTPSPWITPAASTPSAEPAPSPEPAPSAEAAPSPEPAPSAAATPDESTPEPVATVESAATPDATEPGVSPTPSPVGAESTLAPTDVAIQAASTYVCNPNDLYVMTEYLDSTGSPAILKYSNGRLTTEVSNLGKLPTDRPDALAVSSSGYAYFMATAPLAEGTTLTVYRVNLADDTITTFIGATLLGDPDADDGKATVAAGGINPLNGIYYYAHATTDLEWDVYAFDTKSNTSIGYIGRISPDAKGLDGDLAFDGEGNMYLAYYTNDGGRLFRVDAGDLPTTAQPLATPIPFASQGDLGNGYVTGLAYIPATSGTRSIYFASHGSANIYRRSPGTTDDRQSYASNNNQYSFDLASCVAPSTPKLSLSKNVVGRVNATDQFTLSIADSSGATVGTPVTTVGTTNGVQGVKVAPVDIEAGQTYTIKETGAANANLSAYDTSATCKASNGSTIPTTGSNGTWSVTIPTGAMGAISCEIKNVAPPTIMVTKTLSGGRVAASDQFTVQLRTGGATGTILDTPGNETTAGQGTTVDPGTGTTGVYRASTSTAYTITEAAGAGVDMSKYTATVTCTDAAGQNTGLPNKAALGTGYTLTPKPGAQITCTIDNSGQGASIGIGEGLTCEAGYIYAIASTNPSEVGQWGNGNMIRSYGHVYKINVANGEATVAQAELPSTTDASLTMANYASGRFSGRVNALAISQGGLFSYYSTQRTGSAEPLGLPVFQQNNIDGTTKRLATLAIPSGVKSNSGVDRAAGTVRGGIDPTTGIYWISSSETVGTQTRHHFWAYNTLPGPEEDPAIGYVGYIQGPKSEKPYGGNGDLVFDQDGNMLFVSSDGTVGELWRIVGLTKDLPAVTTPTDLSSKVTAVKVTDLDTSGQFNGVSFDNDGYLYVSYTNSSGSSMIAKLDPNTGEQIGQSVPVSGLGNPGSRTRSVVDLADCNDPGGLRLQKDYPHGRVAAADNVTLQITRSDMPSTTIKGGVATTKGPDTGLQTDAAAIAIGVPDKTYILKETVAAGSPLTDYTTTLTCVDKTHGNAPVPVTKTSQGEYSVSFQGVDSEDGRLLANVVCTYTNTPKPKIAVEKVGSTQCLIPGAEPTDVDYTYTVTNPGVVALRDIALTDDKGDTEYVSGDLDGNGELDPGESWVYTMTSALTQTTTNTATVTGVHTTTGEVATATDTWTVAPSPVTVTKTSSATGPVKAGDELTYTMVVTNTGTTDATNVELTDTLPAGVTYVDGSAQKTYWTGEAVPGGTKSGTWTTTLPDFGFSSKQSLQTFSTVGSVPADSQLTSYSITLKGSSTDGKNDVALRGYLPGQTAETGEPGTGATVWTPTAARWFSVPYQKFGSGSGAWTTLSSGTVSASGPASGEYTLQWWDYYNHPNYSDPENTASGVQVTLNYTYTEEASARTQVTNPAHAPGEMVTAADAVTLKPGESMTVTFKVTVDNPLDPAITELTNTATVTYAGDDACAAAGSVTDPVEGTLSTPIQVEKLGQHCDVGRDTCALPGAEFALYDTDPSQAGAQPITDGITVDANNGALFTSIELKPGDYWLVETKAPDGHTLLPAPVKFTLTATGITLDSTHGALVEVKDGYAFTLVVTDTTPAPLPEAGGAGPWGFYVMGLLLLAVAGLYYQMTSVTRLAPQRILR